LAYPQMYTAIDVAMDYHLQRKTITNSTVPVLRDSILGGC
jgi:hypothetical protein